MSKREPVNSVSAFLWRILFLFAATLASASCFAPNSVGETCDAIVGDLVISEFLADAAGADSNREWFEIYNASSRPQVLDRLVIRRYGFKALGTCSAESDKPGELCATNSECLDSCRRASCASYCEGPFTEAEEGRMEVSRTVVRGAGTIEPHSYFVLSDGQRADIKADYNYALREEVDPTSGATGTLVTESLGDFSQSIGGLGISCGGAVVDEVFYGTRNGLPAPASGQTLALSGKIAPDSLVNDDPKWWCLGDLSSEDEILGSCRLDEGRGAASPCRTDEDCEPRRECMQQCDNENAERVDCFPSTAEFCVDDLDCSLLNQTGACAHDSDVSCNADDECLAVAGTCKSSDLETPCYSDCDCDSGCGSCEDYRDASCEGVFESSCESNTCEGYVPSNYGTPGNANSICPFVAYDTCLDGDSERDIQFPQPGELVLSELFADPASTAEFPTNADDNREWIEIYVNSEAPLDLNGLAVVFTKANDDGSTSSRTARITQPTCLAGEPGEYLVLGQSADLEQNGGVQVDGIIEGLDIYNNEELTIELVLHGTVVIDTARVPKSSSGKSSSLPPGVTDPASNDTMESFCKSEASGAFGGGGTPGSANACTAPIGCLDEAESRAIEFPAVGELIVSELLFDPSGSDGNKEWIELYNAGQRTIDVNGLEIINYVVGTESSVKDSVVGGADCITVEPGGYVLIGAVDDALANGGLMVDGVSDDLSFYNSAPGAVEIRLEGLLIDKAIYPDASDGTSVSLKPGELNAASNDVVENFCASQTSGNYDGLGTPGAPNLCGPSCVDEMGTRQVVSPGVDELVVTEIMANPDSSDSGREWFEVYVSSDGDVDLNGLALVADNGNSTRQRTVFSADASCITVSSGSYAVIGGDLASGDGVEVQASWGTSELFYNSDLSFFIQAPDGSIIDSVIGPINAGTTTPAKSHILDGGILDAQGNDGIASWCRSSSAQPAILGFHGSPGLANVNCP